MQVVYILSHCGPVLTADSAASTIPSNNLNNGIFAGRPKKTTCASSIRAERYSNLCTAVFVAAMVFWSNPILRVLLGRGLPMRETLTPLFVVFSLATQFHMLTRPGNFYLAQYWIGRILTRRQTRCW